MATDITSAGIDARQPVAPAAGGMLVSYSPVAMAQRAARFRSALNRQTISLVISVVISGGLWFFYRPGPKTLFFWLLVASVAYSLAQVVKRFVQLKWARKTTSQVPWGPAFQVDSFGVVLSSVPQGERVPWSEVSAIAGLNKAINPGPRLEFRWGQGRSWSVPLIVLDVPPSAMDSGLRAYSRGRFGLDLSAVDDIW